MAFTSDAERSGAQTRGLDLSWDHPDNDKYQEPTRDWKKLFLVVGLGLLSWVATYVGMLELIEANMGDLPLIHKAIIGFSVAMLMVMVVWLLDQMFSDVGWLARSLYAGGYIFLTVISVGFGFGFYWKVLESRSEASRSAESAVGQVQNSLHAAMTRLEQLQGTLDSLTAVSAQKADTERQSGTSCPNSKPGDGPRRKMRDDDAGRFKFAADFVKGRVSSVKADIAALESDLDRIVKDDKSTVDAKSGTRNDFMRNLGRKLDLTVTGFNAFRTDPQLKQIRVDLNERADKVTFIDTKGGTYTCPDSQLSTALKGVVRAIDELPVLEKPKIAAVEGSEAVIEAFRRLTASFYGVLAFKLPPTPEELRELQKKAVQSVEANSATQARLAANADQAGLSKRDYVPLAIAIFVDLCLLLVSMKKGGSRLQNLLPKMRAAERGPVIQILSRFNEIHRDKQIRENFEVFRHVVFDFHGDYYAAVPLNAPYRMNPRNGDLRQGYGVSDAQELLQEAHLLGNLFASFEKEKIFTRVYSPLLSTKTIQKRLRRQGSKFAASEAFRVYRFRNGAWSEIILGAVMGAARRVEADKRRRRAEDGRFRDEHPEPKLSANEDGGFTPEGVREAAVAFGFENSRASQRRSGSAPTDEFRNHGEREIRQPGVHQAGFRNVQPFPSFNPSANRNSNPGTSETSPNADDRKRQAEPNPGQFRHVEPEFQGTLAYSMSRQPSPWPRGEGVEPETSAAPANNNTAPVARESNASGEQQPLPNSKRAPENVILHPAIARSSHGEAKPDVEVAVTPVTEERVVTVAATRETVTYQLPISEVAVPNAFWQPAIAEAPAETAPMPTQSLPPPLPNSHPVAADAVDNLPAVTDEVSATQENASWDAADATGTVDEVDSSASSFANDDFRVMALRLRPDRRET